MMFPIYAIVCNADEQMERSANPEEFGLSYNSI